MFQNRNPTFLLFTLLIGTTFLPLTSFPKRIGYFITLLSYSLFLGWVFVTRSPTLHIDTISFSLLVIIFLIYILNFSSVDSLGDYLGAFQRVPIFIGITLLNLYFIPNIIRREQFFNLLSKIGALLVIIGLPTIVGIELDLGVIGIQQSEEIYFLAPELGLRIPVLTSIFIDSNFFAEFLMLATLASLLEVHHRNHGIWVIFLGINYLGVLLTQSRTGIVATTVGLGIYVAYRILSRKQFYFLSGISFFLGVGMAVFVFRIVPAPDFVPNPDLTGRIELWAASLEAIMHRPLFGYGAGPVEKHLRPFVNPRYVGYSPHNSYLRVALSTGLIGGLAYTLFNLTTVFRMFPAVESYNDVTLLGMMVVTSLDQVFLGFTHFGLSSPSVLQSLVMGYGIKRIMEYRHASRELEEESSEVNMNSPKNSGSRNPQ